MSPLGGQARTQHRPGIELPAPIVRGVSRKILALPFPKSPWKTGFAPSKAPSTSKAPASRWWVLRRRGGKRPRGHRELHRQYID